MINEAGQDGFDNYDTINDHLKSLKELGGFIVIYYLYE